MTPLQKAWEHLKDSDPRYLGGSTGAVLNTLPSGKKVVVKRGAHPKHITNEYDFNRYLNELGVGVPNATLESDDSGQPVMLTDFERGARSPSLSNTQDINRLQRDFVPHAAIANWDVLGMGLDNVLIRPDGTPTYVDVGGSGPYRAQGADKGHAWASSVGELNTMRGIGMRPNDPPFAQDVYGNMGDKELGQSYDAHGGSDAMEQALKVLRDKQTRNTLNERIQDISRRVA